MPLFQFGGEVIASSISKGLESPDHCILDSLVLEELLKGPRQVALDSFDAFQDGGEVPLVPVAKPGSTDRAPQVGMRGEMSPGASPQAAGRGTCHPRR